MRNEKRTYWNVTTVSSNGTKDSGKYRSRHTDAKGVRAEFAKHGHTVTAVKRWKA